MTIEIETTAAFDKRLAELAWEHASDMVKTTVVNTLAMAIAADQNLVQRMTKKIVDEVVARSIAALRESESVVGCITQAQKTIEDTIEKAQQPLADRLSEPLVKSVEKAGELVVTRAIDASTKTLSDDLKHFVGKLSTTYIRSTAMTAVFNGTIEAAKERALDDSFTIDSEFRTAIVNALDAMKKPEPQIKT